MFHLLKYNPSLGTHFELAVDVAYEDHDTALSDAKRLCLTEGTITVVQDVDEVKMAAVVSSFKAPPSPSSVVYRDALGTEQFEGVAPRTPQAKPRLLIVKDRRATPAEIFGHLMVIAEGKVIKNAFGALEVGDMPLSSTELALVVEALK